MMPDKMTLNVCSLSVAFRVYGGIARVLDDVSLHVSEGESVGLVGETGCGKTVTVKTIMGMIRPTSSTLVTGQVLFKETDLIELEHGKLLHRIGRELSMIPQDPMTSLNPVFTVGSQLRDVIRYAGRKHGDPRLSRHQIQKRALDALAAVRLPNPERMLGSYPLQLSGGMRQRVLIAMALVNKPTLLIADEPGTALDVTIQKQVLGLMSNLIAQTGVSVLIISHNLGVIHEMTDRLYIMYAGQIAETAPTRRFFSAPKHPYSRGLRDSVPTISGRALTAGIPGTIPDYLSAPEGCRFHPRCTHAGDRCRTERPAEACLERDWQASCFLHTHTPPCEARQ